jgi:geranylgeranyl reductase family protein
MPQSDVLIVGAGPAGAWAACQLARAGARVAIFDASHPREKPCGGGLTARALALVAGAAAPPRLRPVVATSLRFETASAFTEFPLCSNGDRAGRLAVQDGVRSGSPLTIVDRRSFDAMLLEAATRAGACHVAERVRDVRVGSDGVEAETTSGRWRGDLLLGADGANSLVRRRTGRAFARHQLSVAAGYFLHGVSSSQIRVRCVAQPAGYIWSFPRADHIAVGICAQADATTVERLRALVLDWLGENQLHAGARLEAYAWPIPSLSRADFSSERPAGDRWMLLGDAAGLVDPLTREGIYFALLSAGFAADALTHERRPSAAYVERLGEDVYRELARAADVKARFFGSGFADLMVQGFERSEAIRQVMVDLVSGTQPYATLKRRLLGTFEVRLALQLLWLQVMGRFGRAGHSDACAAPRL